MAAKLGSNQFGSKRTSRGSVDGDTIDRTGTSVDFTVPYTTSSMGNNCKDFMLKICQSPDPPGLKAGGLENLTMQLTQMGVLPDLTNFQKQVGWGTWLVLTQMGGCRFRWGAARCQAGLTPPLLTNPVATTAKSKLNILFFMLLILYGVLFGSYFCGFESF